MKLNMKTSLRVLLTLTAVTHLSWSAGAAEEGFKSLFNGKDLTGWEGRKEHWSVEDGTLTGITTVDVPAKGNNFLIAKDGDKSLVVGDFELRCSYKFTGDFGNSGIQYRSKDFGDFVVGGYQADMEVGTTYSGILYEERMTRGIMAARGEKVVWNAEGKKEVVGKTEKTTEEIQAAINKNGWNDYVVIAKGNHLQHFINGLLTVDVVDNDPSKRVMTGILALQLHAGPPMKVQFKNIRIKASPVVAKSDLENMQGDWVPVELVGNGEAAGNEVLSRIKLAITGKDYAVHTGDSEDGGSFALNETASPKQMDVKTKNGDSVTAIYEFSGDMMRVCYVLNNGARPTEFKSTTGSDRIVALYKRVP